jgi:hypothetical protein
MRASLAARPSHPCAWLRREPVGAMRCKAKGENVRRKKGERHRRVGPTRQRGRKRKRAPAGWAAKFSNLLGSVGPAG